jgi:hypothetical protein
LYQERRRIFLSASPAYDPLTFHLGHDEKSLHDGKLATSYMVFRAIIHIDDSRGDMGEPLTDGFPPLGEAIYATVTGDFRGHAVHPQFIQRREEDAHGCHGRQRLKVVVRGLDLDARLPAAGKGANFDRCFGIHGNPQDDVRRVGGVIDLGHLLEDGLGFWDFFAADS